MRSCSLGRSVADPLVSVWMVVVGFDHGIISGDSVWLWEIEPLISSGLSLRTLFGQRRSQGGDLTVCELKATAQLASSPSTPLFRSCRKFPIHDQTSGFRGRNGREIDGKLPVLDQLILPNKHRCPLLTVSPRDRAATAIASGTASSIVRIVPPFFFFGFHISISFIEEPL